MGYSGNDSSDMYGAQPRPMSRYGSGLVTGAGVGGGADGGEFDQMGSGGPRQYINGNNEEEYGYGYGYGGR